MQSHSVRRVVETPIREVHFRKKLIKVEQPEVGCIVSQRDKHHISDGAKRSCVVVRIWKTKDGVTNVVELATIKEISDIDIILGEYGVKLSLYINNDWPRWSDDPNPDAEDYYYQWDEYITSSEGNPYCY